MSVPMAFPTMLRARPGAIILGDVSANAWTVRVQAADAWDAVRVTCAPGTSVREVKRAAMQALLPDVTVLDDQVVKLRGVLVRDEAQSLQVAGVQNASTLFLAPRRRRPLL